MAKLERQLRIARAIGLIIGFILVNAVFLRDHSRIEAREFVLEDAEGNVAAELSDRAGAGGGTLTLRDAKGNMVYLHAGGINVSLPDRQCPGGGGTCGGPYLSLSPSGLSLVDSSAAESSGTVSLQMQDGHPWLLLTDAETGVVAEFPRQLGGGGATVSVSPGGDG